MRSEANPNVLIIVTDDQRAGILARYAQDASDLRPRRNTLSQRIRHDLSMLSLSCIDPFGSVRAQPSRAQEYGLYKQLDQETTLQRYLHDAGYRTAFFGKYLNGWDSRTRHGIFDAWSLFSSR